MNKKVITGGIVAASIAAATTASYMSGEDISPEKRALSKKLIEQRLDSINKEFLYSGAPPKVVKERDALIDRLAELSD